MKNLPTFEDYINEAKQTVIEGKLKVPKTIKNTSDLEKYFYGIDLKKAKEIWGKSFGYHLTGADDKSYFVSFDGKKRVIKLTDLEESVNDELNEGLFDSIYKETTSNRLDLGDGFDEWKSQIEKTLGAKTEDILQVDEYSAEDGKSTAKAYDILRKKFRTTENIDIEDHIMEYDSKLNVMKFQDRYDGFIAFLITKDSKI